MNMAEVDYLLPTTTKYIQYDIAINDNNFSNTAALFA